MLKPLRPLSVQLSVFTANFLEPLAPVCQRNYHVSSAMAPSNKAISGVFMFSFRFCTALLAFSACVRPDGAHETLPGKELYAACVACHGPKAIGNPSILAPAIAGLPEWYVVAQLHKYRTGIRGAHPDDAEGLRMRPMSRQMMDEGEVLAVAKYVSSLTPHKAVPMIVGDAKAGEGSYATCTACHGPDGKGNKALNAPPIAGQYDWYLASQLKKFKAGIRGANQYDVTGAQMRPMSMTLVDDAAVNNVVAYINTIAARGN
jgi:cytochrome c553